MGISSINHHIVIMNYISIRTNRCCQTIMMMGIIMYPFEGIFGDTVELRLIEFFMTVCEHDELSYSIDDLAQFVDSPVETILPALNPLIKWGIIIPIKSHGKGEEPDIWMYKGNSKSILMGEIIMLNDVLIDMMLNNDNLMKCDE